MKTRPVTYLDDDGKSRVVNVATSYEYPPIPIRDFDWSAIDYDTFDGEGSPSGSGRTEEAAISDLIEQLKERTS